MVTKTLSLKRVIQTATVTLPLLGLLASCASAPGPQRDVSVSELPEKTVVEPPQKSVAEPPDRDKVRHTLSNPAVVALWEQAEQARSEKRLEVAVAALERALRIEPTDPILWSRLSELSLRQGQMAQAENFAAKSNALAGDNLTLRYRNWLIIESARKTRSDLEGLREAQDEVRRLKARLQGN